MIERVIRIATSFEAALIRAGISRRRRGSKPCPAGCGRTISANKDLCRNCAESAEAGTK